MKLTAVLLLIGCLQVSAAAYSQRITLHEKNAPIEKVLKEIKKQTNYFFLYSTELLENAKPVNVQAENLLLEKVLEQCFFGQPFSYEIDGKTILIKPLQHTRTTASLPQIKVTGKVMDSRGGLPGVSVKLKESSIATSTDVDGNYVITVPDNGVLIFSSIGYSSQEIAVNGRTTINVTLAEQQQTLNEVVVTALGLERGSKSLTYSTQNISGAEVSRVKDANFMNTLAGKAAGVVITKGSGGPGASTRVILRGNKSITGNNQPLYVIDGIPMNNSSSTSSNTLFSQQDFGDAISNLNPEDIESVQVLKGASAAALYGSQAANGVILLTTKKGKKGITKIDFSSTTTLENAIGLPENQTSYGQVVQGVTNESWGAKITNGSNSHISNFFNTGRNYLNSLSLSSGNELGQVYLSYANTQANGIVPQNGLTRHNINLRGTAQVFNNKLSIDGSINYINQAVKNRPQSGYYLSPIFSLYLFPTGDDFSKYSGNNFEVWDPVRLMNRQNWPYIVNEASSNQNPYWIQNRNQNDMGRERTISTFSAKYNLTNWLSFQGRATYDRVQDSYEQRISATTDPVQAHANGGYSKSLTNNNQLYSDFLLTGNGNVSKNISLAATLGYSITKNNASGMSFSSVTSSGLSYPNYFSIYGLNFPFNSSESLRRSLNQSLFGTATFGFKERLFLDVTGRSEWSSTVEQNFFYPSTGLSYVLIPEAVKDGPVSFAKLRGSYSEVGNALSFGVANLNPRYSLSNDENINPRGTLPYFSGSDTTRLQPERTRSFEAGTDVRFFNDKLTLNLTYYHATTSNQVFTIGAPAGSGASNFYINGGTIRNQGIEGVLSYDARVGNVKWSPGLNFSHNKNQIIELSDLLTTPRFVLTTIDATRQVQVFLTRPEGDHYGSYGDLYGKRIQYNTDGSVKVDANGLPELSKNPDEFIGNANPKFLAGFNNKFTYRKLNLGLLIDGRFGGKIVSVTETWRDWKGLSQRTAEARDNGGVLVNGKLVPAEAYYKRISGSGQQGAAELYTFDATNIRLREVAIGYTVPKFRGAVKDLNISLVGRNLFFFHKEAPFDPEVSIAPANGLQGLEGFNLPSTRSYGLTIKASF